MSSSSINKSLLYLILITFTDDTASRIANIRYLVVNAPSAYNILLGRPALNMIGAVASSRHMKMKLPSFEGVVITMKSDKKEVKKVLREQPQDKERSVHSHHLTSKGRRGHRHRDHPGKTTRACRRSAREGDRG